MNTNKLLATVVVLQGLILIGQWTGGGAGALPAAQAQIPDPANRQMQMIEKLESIDGKLGTIVSILQDGEVQVRVPKAEENKGAAK